MISREDQDRDRAAAWAALGIDHAQAERDNCWLAPSVASTIDYLKNLAWVGVTVMRGTPYQQCRLCRGVDPRCTEMIKESGVTNVGHQAGCPYLVVP